MTRPATTAFGSTGLQVTPLCLGTSSWGPPRQGEAPEQRDARLAELADSVLAGDLPINFIDTSNEYGQSMSEGFLGAALERAGGLHADFVVQTKLDRDTSTGDFSADQMWRSVEQSLDRLGVDRLQVLYLHDPEHIGFAASMAPGGPVEALLEMQEQEIAANIGISGGPVDMLRQFVETDTFGALVTHNRFTLVDRSASALLDAATARGMGVTNAAPFGGGILTGDPRFRDTYGYRPVRPEVRVAVDRIEELCVRYGTTLGAAAVQFSMREPRIHSTIVGVSTLARLQVTVRDAATAIPDAFWAEVESLVPAGNALDG